MRLQLSDIATAVQGELIGADIAVNGIGIDTRTLQAGDLYIAIKGKQFDGHDFVDKAQQAEQLLFWSSDKSTPICRKLLLRTAIWRWQN